MDSTVAFSSSAALVGRLGDGLIRDPDATEVVVTFRKTDTERGTIEVRDNCSGMTLQDLHTKWARAASENKVTEPYTPRLNRRRLGAKGIGRFSVAKLGARVKVITRTPDSPHQLVFKIDFREFTDDKDFSQMGQIATMAGRFERHGPLERHVPFSVNGEHCGCRVPKPILNSTCNSRSRSNRKQVSKRACENVALNRRADNAERCYEVCASG